MLSRACRRGQWQSDFVLPGSEAAVRLAMERLIFPSSATSWENQK